MDFEEEVLLLVAANKEEQLELQHHRNNSFPRNEKKREQWRVALNLEKEKLFTHSRVCNLHFNKEAYDLEKSPFAIHLKNDAIPSENVTPDYARPSTSTGAYEGNNGIEIKTSDSPRLKKKQDSQEYSMMTSETSITDIEEAETKQNTCGTYFIDIDDILKREIKEEATQFEPFSEYGVPNECLKKHENEIFIDRNSSEFDVMTRNTVEDTKESKFFPTCYGGNTNSNDLGGELAKPKVNHFNNGVILKTEDHSECTDDRKTNSAEWKTETHKTEDDTDIIYEDIKPQILEGKSSEKTEYESHSNSFADILIGTETKPSFHQLSKDSETLPLQHREEDETAAEKDNDTRKEMSIDSNIDSKSFAPKNNVRQLESIHTGGKPFQCKICSKIFVAKCRLLKHERTHIEEKPFQCKVCAKPFKQKVCLTIHEKIHTGEKQFQCKICLKKFVVKSRLLKHEIIHTGEKPFQCKICSKNFAVKYNLLVHERIHTEEKPFQCEICSKSFVVKSRLLTHERIHRGEKLFQCKICSKNFATKSSLLKHESIHTGEKPFQCKICLKNFSVKCNLLVHERIHTEGKPFLCKICAKPFKHKASLTIHERIHTGETLFQCKICLKNFAVESRLLTHEMSHTGNKPFLCKICAKQFKHKASLTIHERIHTEEKQFQCKI